MIVNWGTALLTSLAGALGSVFSFVPKLIGFLVILLIGWIVGAALAKGVTYLLRRLGFERVSQRIGLTHLEQRMGIRMDTAHILGRVVFWFVFLIFLVPAVNALGIPTISALLGTLVDYIPNIFVAILVLFLGTLLATVTADLIRRAMANTRAEHVDLLANVIRYAIIGFAALIALNQLQIAPALIQILFAAVMGGLALAVGLSFGLGGREAAQRWLARGETALSTGNGKAAMPSSTATPMQGRMPADASQPYDRTSAQPGAFNTDQSRL